MIYIYIYIYIILESSGALRAPLFLRNRIQQTKYQSSATSCTFQFLRTYTCANASQVAAHMLQSSQSTQDAIDMSAHKDGSDPSIAIVQSQGEGAFADIILSKQACKSLRGYNVQCKRHLAPNFSQFSKRGPPPNHKL